MTLAITFACTGLAAFVASAWLLRRCDALGRDTAAFLAEIKEKIAQLPAPIDPPTEPGGWGWYVPDRVRLVDGFATRREAIEGAIREGHTTDVHVGEVRAMDIAQWIDADDVREMARDRAYDVLCLEDLDVACGPEDEANRALTQWARRYLDADCTSYCEGDEVPAEEIASIRAAMDPDAIRIADDMAGDA